MFILNGLLKAESQEKILIYLFIKKSGYAKQIAEFFSIGVTPVQKQLLKMEEDGLLISYAVGRSRVFEINPQYRFREILEELIIQALELYPTEIKSALVMERRKPRRSGKPAERVYK